MVHLNWQKKELANLKQIDRNYESQRTMRNKGMRKNEPQNLKEMWDTMKCHNICTKGIPEGKQKEKEKKEKNKLRKIMAVNTLYLLKNSYITARKQNEIETHKIVQ